MQSDTVIVTPIFKWQCLKCNHINISEGVEVSDDQLKEVVEQVAVLFGDSKGPPQGMIEPPFEVQCEKCHTDFFTEQQVY